MCLGQWLVFSASGVDQRGDDDGNQDERYDTRRSEGVHGGFGTNESYRDFRLTR
jgi:hypothetical protein